MNLSFITATYNGLDYTKAFLKSFEVHLPTTTPDYEFILVDDGSSDGTRDYIEKLEKPFKAILNEQNLGFAGANNRGAKEARGDYLVFLNNDLILEKGWLEPMLNAFKNVNDLGAVGNIQISTRTKLIDHAGVFFDLQGLPLHARKGRKRIPKTPYKEWNAITAACMVIRRDLFIELGGFDEAYRNGSEDIDLCMKIKQSGRRLLVANESVIQHHISISPGRNDRNATNSALFMGRWSSSTAEWGAREWPSEYLHRYARCFWKFNLTKLLKAIFLLARRILRQD